MDNAKLKNDLPREDEVESAIDFIIVPREDVESEEDGGAIPADRSLAVRNLLEKRFSIQTLENLTQYLPKKFSYRYKALILNIWKDGYNSPHYEVGLVHHKNGDHRDGVTRALGVSPLNVKYFAIEESFFKFLHGHLYNPMNETQMREHRQKQEAQKTKQWGEGKTELSEEEVYSLQAATEADYANEAEEWLDLTNQEEYERNIKRSEAELTTQEFIRLILMEFLRSGSSDMHIEAGQPTGRIRFRYDSEMFTRWDKIPFVKIKQLCMGLAETSGKDATQMKFKDIDSTVKVKALRDGKPADVELRFASQPTLYAPSIVLRSQLKPIRDINEVGFLPRQLVDLEAAYSQKRGILTITGATGSGKTNTLEAIYAILEEPDTFKIIEIGEPIEIRSTRRTQMSLRPNTPFTWWDAFYSCLRADPDIIGIGELRSSEHTSLAINAALTGHLVLSTFHAASVEDTLSRMFQMGIPRENLATGMNLILAQALIKKLCERCKVIDDKPSEHYNREIYKAVGCPECFNKGTRGRTAIAELLYFNEEVKEWIQNRSLTARDVALKAMHAGYLIPMKEVAREKVLSGITSEMEVAAVLGLVESKRQHENYAYSDVDRTEARRVTNVFQEEFNREEIIEGEILG